MALWGNKDTFSDLVGTIELNYSTKVVTGDTTTFVTAGISTGDVITIGAGGTFGEAVIAGVTSETQLLIASTQFLSGATISAGTAYTVSQKPIYTLGDVSYSYALDADSTITDQGIVGTATTNAGIGTDVIPVVVGDLDVLVNDYVVNDGNNILISSIQSTTVSLASTISAGISTGDTVEFRRLTGGYFKDVFGVDKNEVSLASTTKYAVAHSGWVGVQTYVDMHGNLRVKSEVLVAGGISTSFDANDDAFFPE
jgi:hypothetical protein